MNCKKCGNLLNRETNFCSICGTKIQKKSNLKIILILLIIVIISGISIFIIFNKNNKLSNNQNINETLENEQNNMMNEDNNLNDTYTFKLFEPSKIEKTTKDDSESTRNIEIKEIFFNPDYKKYTTTRDAYIYGINNNAEAITVKITLEYYDSEGYRIKRTTESDIVDAGKEFVLNMYIENDNLKYNKVKLFYEASKVKSYQTVINLNELEYTNEIIDDNIILNVKNNSNTRLYFGNVACLYYKEKKLVFAVNSTILNLNPSETGETKFYSHKLNLNDDYKNLKKIEYDDYRIVIYSAYDSESTNY